MAARALSSLVPLSDLVDACHAILRRLPAPSDVSLDEENVAPFTMAYVLPPTGSVTAVHGALLQVRYFRVVFVPAIARGTPTPYGPL